MKIVRTTPLTRNQEIAKYDLDAVAFDLERNEIVVTYNPQNASNVDQGGQELLTIDGADYNNFFQVAQQRIAAGDTFANAMRRALFQKIIDVTGLDATIGN